MESFYVGSEDKLSYRVSIFSITFSNVRRRLQIETIQYRIYISGNQVITALSTDYIYW